MAVTPLQGCILFPVHWNNSGSEYHKRKYHIQLKLRRDYEFSVRNFLAKFIAKLHFAVIYLSLSQFN